MIPSTTLNSNSLNSISTPKFFRRKDLTTEIRLDIAYNASKAQQLKEYGTITAIAKQYNICRDTVYNLLKPLKNITSNLFSPKKKTL